MRIFVYEFVTGGGWFGHSDQPPPDSLAGEGRAMRDALAADLAAVDGTSVDVLHDARHGAVEIPGVAVHPINSAVTEKRAIERPYTLARSVSSGSAMRKSRQPH